MRTCKLFDRYRDGELNSAERSAYESHLASCEDCRARMSLLNNLVQIIRAEDVQPLDTADRIARRAFERGHSWDVEVISWLRPGPALAALTLMLALFSSLWIFMGNRQVIAYSEYEKLMEEATAMNSGTLTPARNASELFLWLEQEGKTSD